MKRLYNLENSFYKKNFSRIYRILFTADLDEIFDYSSWFKKNPDYIDLQRPLWIIAESKKINKRIWICKEFGKLEINIGTLDLPFGSIAYSNSIKNYRFDNQKEMADFLEKVLQPCIENEDKRGKSKMSKNRFVQIYNILQDELLEMHLLKDTLSPVESNIYDEMKKLKETLTNYFVKKLMSNKKLFEYKDCQMIGLNKYLYVFENKNELEMAHKELSKIGKVKEVNECSLEFREDKRILSDNIIPFSELSQIEIEHSLKNYLGISVTIGDENIDIIREKMGDLGVRLYKKYYNWYQEKGTYEIYDFVDSFCCGKVEEINSYLDEVIEDTKKNEQNISERNEIIQEIELDKDELILYEKKMEDSEELE